MRITMADGRSSNSSVSNENCFTNVCDFHKIDECITFNRILWDGERLKWHGSYEALQDFVDKGLCQKGRWWLPGGNSKRFDASAFDLILIWYPGKSNTLIFKGKDGVQTKDCLIKLCEQRSSGKNTAVPLECRVVGDENMDNIMLEIKILQCRMASMESLIGSQTDSMITIANLSRQLTQLQADLEEQTVRNRLLESEVNFLNNEITIIKSYRNEPINALKSAISNTKDASINTEVISIDLLPEDVPSINVPVIPVDDSILVDKLSDNMPVRNKTTAQIWNLTEPKTGLIGDCPKDCAYSYEEQLNNYRIKHAFRITPVLPTMMKRNDNLHKEAEDNSFEAQLNDYRSKHDHYQKTYRTGSQNAHDLLANDKTTSRHSQTIKKMSRRSKKTKNHKGTGHVSKLTLPTVHNSANQKSTSAFNPNEHPTTGNGKSSIKINASLKSHEGHDNAQKINVIVGNRLPYRSRNPFFYPKSNRNRKRKYRSNNANGTPKLETLV